MPRYLLLRLEAPLVAFGDVVVGADGPVDDVPSASMLTGLMGNALGFRREEGERLSRLQERLVFGARIDARERRFEDFQTAQLHKNDVGWTTRGQPEARAGADDTYRSPHIRSREFDSGVRCLVTVRLLDEGEPPTIDDLARAMDEPARPLFIGRKSCLPAAPIFAGFVEAESAFKAILSVPLDVHAARRRTVGKDRRVLVALPDTEPQPEGFREHFSTGSRDWTVGVHVGQSITFRMEVDAAWFAGAGGPSR